MSSNVCACWCVASLLVVLEVFLRSTSKSHVTFRILRFLVELLSFCNTDAICIFFGESSRTILQQLVDRSIGLQWRNYSQLALCNAKYSLVSSVGLIFVELRTCQVKVNNVLFFSVRKIISTWNWDLNRNLNVDLNMDVLSYYRCNGRALQSLPECIHFHFRNDKIFWISQIEIDDFPESFLVRFLVRLTFFVMFDNFDEQW